MTRAVTSASDRLAEPLAAVLRALWVAAFAREHYGRRDAPSSADRSELRGARHRLADRTFVSRETPYPVERDPLGWGALTSSKRGAHLATRSCGRNHAANP